MRWSVLDRSPFVDFVSWVTLICTNWVQLRELHLFAYANLSCASCVVFHELLWVVLSCSCSDPERLLRHCGVGLSAKGMANGYVQSSCKETNWLLPCIEYYLQLYPMDLRSALYSMTTCLVPLQFFIVAKVPLPFLEIYFPNSFFSTFSFRCQFNCYNLHRPSLIPHRSHF